MNSTDIATKTEKGREELATRGNGLTARQRQLLITIDGSHSVGEIARRQPDAVECITLLQELLSRGLISLEGGEGGAGVSPAPGSVPTGTAAPEIDRLNLAKSYLTNFVNGIMGPGNDNIIERIRGCISRSELDVIAKSCCEVVASVAGRRKADQFMAELDKILSEQ